VTISSVYRNPYRHTHLETLDHVNLDTVAQATEITLNLLLYWDRKLNRVDRDTLSFKVCKEWS
jgi:hypothetical protein